MRHLNFLNEKFPVRQSEEQKKAFRDYALDYINENGLEAKVEITKNGKNKNIVVGDPLTAKVVFTAHYDTPNLSLFPNIMIPRNIPLFFLYQMLPVFLILSISIVAAWLIGMVWLQNERAYMISFLVMYFGLYFLLFRTFKNPNNHNDNTSGVATLFSIIDRLGKDKASDVAFIFFDNEEKGKLGSKEYFKDHKEEMTDRTLINFDCVGNGDTIVFIAMKGAEAKPDWKLLHETFIPNEYFRCEFYPMRGSESNSDYKNFPVGIGCMACKKSKHGLLYTPYIHTAKDIVASEENIEFISECAWGFIEKLDKKI